MDRLLDGGFGRRLGGHCTAGLELYLPLFLFFHVLSFESFFNEMYLQRAHTSAGKDFCNSNLAPSRVTNTLEGILILSLLEFPAERNALLSLEFPLETMETPYM